MSDKKKIYPSPKFKSIEEEEQYWTTHSPLDEGYEVVTEKGERKLSSILTVRLTGEEITQLRDLAAELGVGPSTYARMVLKSVIKRHKLDNKQVKSLTGKPNVGKASEGFYILNEEDAECVSRIAEEIKSLKDILAASKNKTKNTDNNN